MIGVPSCFSGGRKIVKVHEVDRGVGLEHVAPGALAGMRLARDQQHAQVFAHALDREHGAIVDGGELALGRLGFDLDDIGAGVIDIDRDLHRFADADGPRHRRLALMGDGELDRAADLRGRRIGDLDLDLLGAADNAETGRAQDLEPAVELALLAGQKRMHRRIEAKAGGGSGHVMHLAFGNHDHPGEPVGRHVGKRLGEIGEQHGAVALAVGRGRGGVHPAHIEIGEGLEALLQFLADLVGARGAAGDRLALAVVEHHGDHVVKGSRSSCFRCGLAMASSNSA